MTRIEHLQFLGLMIPTFVLLLAAAVSMADLAAPAAPAGGDAVAVAELMLPGDVLWDDPSAP